MNLNPGFFALHGRDREIAELFGLFEGPPAIHIIRGAYGVGKTALILRVAQLLADRGWHILGYASTRQADGHGFFTHDPNWKSAADLLKTVETDLAAQAASLPPADARTSFDPISAALSRISASNGRVLFVLDDLAGLALDAAAEYRLEHVARMLPEGCQIAITGRPTISCAYQRPPRFSRIFELEGLASGPFHSLLYELGITGSEEEIELLYRVMAGSPLAAIECSRMGRNLAEIDLDKVAARMDQQLLQSFTDQLERLPPEAARVLEKSLEVLAIVREEISVLDLVRFLPGNLKPLQVWSYLRRSRLLDLCMPKKLDADLLDTRLELDPIMRRTVQSDYFAGDLRGKHQALLQTFDVDHLFDRRNYLYHYLLAFDDSELASRAQQVPWRNLLERALHDDCTSSDNFLPGDFVDLLRRLEEGRSRDKVEKEIQYFFQDNATSDWRRDSSAESWRSEELSSRLSPFLGSCSSRPTIRLALDTWPGYYPLFALESDLKQHGIELRRIQGSAAKVNALLRREVDLIGSTPGCLSGLERSMLRQCHVVGVLNRSMGNDRVLAEGQNFGAAQRGRGPLKTLVVRGSTSHLFLLWFLRQHQISVSDVDFEYVKDYVSIVQRAAELDLHLISIWEPYATNIQHRRPAFRCVFDSSIGPGIVFDYLVTEREKSNAPEFRKALAHLWRLYDEIISGDDAARRIAERIAAVGEMQREEVESSLRRMRFFNEAERRAFFEDAAQDDSFEQVMIRAAETWATTPDRPNANMPLSLWKKDLLEIAAGDGSGWLHAVSLGPQAIVADAELAQLTSDLESLYREANRLYGEIARRQSLFRFESVAFDKFHVDSSKPVKSRAEFGLFIIELNTVFDEALPTWIRRSEESAPAAGLNPLKAAFRNSHFVDVSRLRNWFTHVKTDDEITGILFRYTQQSRLQEAEDAGWSQLQRGILTSVKKTLASAVEILRSSEIQVSSKDASASS
ncbi:MAG TPA: AAA family ATPase [Bryobacteraceae bacterium]|nr:AAA family ATPase [Bryobacteraceae bacterium]